MTISPKAVRVLDKVFEADSTSEKAIVVMAMDDVLSIQGITVTGIALVNELQKDIKGNKVTSFLGGGAE